MPDPRGDEGFVVASGYFVSARPYDSDCEEPGVLYSQAYCVHDGTPAIRFVVQEVFVGRLPARSTAFSRGMRLLPERFPLGSGKPVMTMSSNGDLLQFGELSRTRTGEWALPVALRDDLPLLPCDEVELKAVALDFAEPRPTRFANDYANGEMEIRRKSAWVTEQGDAIQLNYGITLNAIREAAKACR